MSSSNGSSDGSSNGSSDGSSNGSSDGSSNGSSEIELLIEKDEKEEKICRYCQDVKDISVLLHPCKCKGSTKYIHRNCLNRWRNMNIQKNSTCELCKFVYIIRRENIADNHNKDLLPNIIALCETSKILLKYILIYAILIGFLMFLTFNGDIHNNENLSKKIALPAGLIYFIFSNCILAFIMNLFTTCNLYSLLPDNGNRIGKIIVVLIGMTIGFILTFFGVMYSIISTFFDTKRMYLMNNN
jgi:E3 ubiquitin-protein ligase DOA10